MVPGDTNVVEPSRSESATGLKTGISSPGKPVPQPPTPIRIPPELNLLAAGRLVHDTTAPQSENARRLVAAANDQGIDLSLMWGTVDRDPAGRPRVRHVCLAVPGAGRTAMLVLSPPPAGHQDWLGDDAVQRAERAACVSRACRALAAFEGERNTRIAIAQALPDPSEPWAVAAFLEAGFTHIADLVYMRRPLVVRPAGADARPAPGHEPPWPDGVAVRNVRGVAPGEPDREALIEALERSYDGTLDCPGLCGLRSTADVLDSHRATGRWDARHWRLVFLHNRPRGCLLLTHCPDHDGVELVYLGLSKDLRGRGLARRLLFFGLSAIAHVDADHVACAVDTRNAPALRLYKGLGFTVSASRVALVKPIP